LSGALPKDNAPHSRERYGGTIYNDSGMAPKTAKVGIAITPTIHDQVRSLSASTQRVDVDGLVGQ
jgi:hypothetical protein